MKKAVLTILAAGLFLLAPPARAQSPFGDMASATPSLFDEAGSGPSVSLARVVYNVQTGKRWARIQGTTACIGNKTETWGEQPKDPDPKRLMPFFRRGLQASGAQVIDPSDDLFNNQRSSAEFAVGGVITNIEADFCYPAEISVVAHAMTFGLSSFANAFSSGMDRTKVKGHAQMTVEWQIYSTLERRVVGRVVTTGQADTPNAISQNESVIVLAAFADAARALAATSEFQTTVRSRSPQQALQPISRAPLIFHNGSDARKISETPRAVVLVLTSSGHGSGVLIASEGYVLTNDHVVGDAKFVKVRWADGVEGLGEVLRRDRRRDVALIKVDPQNRQPLTIRTTTAATGDTVFAVGAPLDIQFQSSVTRGIVSAQRTYENLAFIQSDVTVNPGNSGGPLLDESGAVIGLTDLGYQPEGVPTNINLFIPIGDALTYLALTPR